MFSKLAWPFAVHGTLVLLNTKYNDILMFIWGRGALAKAKEGQREKFQVKRESLLTSTSGGCNPQSA